MRGHHSTAHSRLITGRTLPDAILDSQLIGRSRDITRTLASEVSELAVSFHFKGRGERRMGTGAGELRDMAISPFCPHAGRRRANRPQGHASICAAAGYSHVFPCPCRPCANNPGAGGIIELPGGCTPHMQRRLSPRTRSLAIMAAMPLFL